MDKYLGVRLDNRYEIREIVGVGGMAIVYKAYDRFAERNVAVKILKDEFAQDEEFRRRFKNESRAIAMFSHPNIVSIYDVGSGEGPQYIVMEYINGITLQQYIDAKRCFLFTMLSLLWSRPSKEFSTLTSAVLSTEI